MSNGNEQRLGPNYFWACVQSVAVIVLFGCGCWFGALNERAQFEREAKRHYWGQWNPFTDQWEWDNAAVWPGRHGPWDSQEPQQE